MSKYVKKDFFNNFKKTVGDQERPDRNENAGSFNKWANPQVGQEYKVRFLPDATGQNFYKKYYYHMFEVGGKWVFSLCPKTFDMENYCSCCSVTNKLWKAGTDRDKTEASRFKRKEKFVSNIFVVTDPRDQDKDEDQKVSGKVKTFEFAAKLESIIRTSLMDAEDGVGPAGFDPSDDGINFIIRVTETKPDERGKKWPEYTTSSFARNPSSIADSEEEVDEIMKNVIDLDEYLKGMAPDEAKIIEALKEEQVYDLIEEEYERILSKRGKKQMLNDSTEGKQEVKRSATKKVEEDEAPEDDVVEDKQEVKEEKKVETKKAPSKSSDTTLDDELLAELAGM